MKKLYFVMVALIVASMVLAACGGGATEPPAATEVPATEAPATEMPATEAPATEAPTEPPAAEVTQADCPKEEVFCVGLVTDVGKVNDKSFNQSAWEGAQKSQEDGVADLVQFIETADAKDYAKNIGTFADAGFDVIVTVGFALGEATLAAGTAYPDTKFIGVDQFQAWEFDDDTTNDSTNVTGLGFPEDQAGFLVGALAAMMSESHVIGAVCGTDVVPPVWRYGEGYKAGAAYADEKNSTTTEVQVVYHSDVGFDKTFTDPEWGAQTAKSMMDNGADAIFGCGGITGNGAITAAAQAGKFAIGVDADQYLTLPEAAPRMLSSALKLITPGVAELIAAAKDGSLAPGNFTGQGGYAPYHDLESEVPDDVKAAMEELNAALLDGSVKTDVPPAKP